MGKVLIPSDLSYRKELVCPRTLMIQNTIKKRVMNFLKILRHYFITIAS